MKMDNVVLSMRKEEVQEILRVSFEDDEKEALRILKKIAKRLENELKQKWVPVFEVCYRPGRNFLDKY